MAAAPGPDEPEKGKVTWGLWAAWVGTSGVRAGAFYGRGLWSWET